VRAAEISLDDGKNWLPLGARSMPVLDGALIRTTSGGAIIELGDGSRLNVMPFSSLRVRESSGGTRVSLSHGRLGFRLPRETRVDITSAALRLEPVRTKAMEGELFVTQEGTAGLKMAAGSIQVHELNGGHPVRLASLEPVFMPRRPATTGPLFTSEAPSRPPAGAKAVFDPKGESLGYLRPDAQLVVQPGYTADLTQPFPRKLVQVAMAKVDAKHRADAVPIFDVNGGYVGYLSGPVFYAQAQLAPGQAAEGQVTQGQAQVAQAQLTQAVAPVGGVMAGADIAALGAAGGSIAVFGGVAAAGSTGTFDAATPTGPSD
jgi:hypothetical protein